MIIPEYSGYSFIDGEVVRNKDKKVMKVYLRRKGDNQYYLLKDKKGVIRQVIPEKIKSLCGFTMKLPEGSSIIPFSNGKYFLDKKGNIYSFSRANPCGKELKPQIGTSGYPAVEIFYKGKVRRKDIHQLMCVTFIQQDYVEKGFVCMHEDDNKVNCELTNLSVGTYSQNNKGAYHTGVNRGNGLRERKLEQELCT